jgi:hypothetical protein
MKIDVGTPLLKQLSPYYGIEPAHQKYVPLSRFHGTQRLNLMRPTRLPANSRRYTYGDPVHLIDWRAYARNEQLIVREQNDEASCRVTVLIEGLSSMDWPNADTSPTLRCSKRELAWRIAMHLVYQFYRWGDQVKLFLVNDKEAMALPLRSQVDTAITFEKLQKQDFLTKAGDFAPPRSLDIVREEFGDLVFWISDGFRGIPGWFERRNPSLVCWLHTLSSLELDTNWMDPDSCYFDTTRSVKEFMGSSLMVGENLHKAVHSWQETIAGDWLKRFAHYLLLSDETPIRNYLQALEQPWIHQVRSRGRSF